MRRRLLAAHGRLLVDDAGQCLHLRGGQSEGLGLLQAGLCPEGVMLFLHALQQLLGADVPVDLVGVGDEEAGQGGPAESQPGAEAAVGQRVGQCRAVGHQLASEGSGHHVERPHLGDGEHHGRLVAALQLSEDVEGAALRLDGESPRMDAVFIVAMSQECAQSCHGVGRSHGRQLVVDGVGRVVAVDVEVLRLVAGREVGHEIIVGHAQQSQQAEGDRHQIIIGLGQFHDV